MTDLHVHILPGVDDGSPNLSTSLEMAEMAAQSGVRILAVTPHANQTGIEGVEDGYVNYESEQLEEQFYRLEREINREHIPISLVRGMEIADQACKVFSRGCARQALAPPGDQDFEGLPDIADIGRQPERPVGFGDAFLREEALCGSTKLPDQPVERRQLRPERGPRGPGQRGPDTARPPGQTVDP